MLDDLLELLFDDVDLGHVPSRRAQLLARLFLGLLGAGLGTTGAVYIAGRPLAPGNPAMHASMVLLFVAMASLFLCNVALARRWRWPWILFAASFVAMFVARIAFGA